MRRPTRAETYRRRLLIGGVGGVAIGLVIALLGSWLGVFGGDGSAADPSAAEVPTTAAASTTTAPRAPTTTAPFESTGRMVPDTSTAGPVAGTGPLRTYRVEVEVGTHVDVDAFAPVVEEILSDPRGWTNADGISLQRVTSPDADVVVSLATPGTVDLLCYPLATDGDVSCAQESQAIINVKRWQEGAAPSGLGLADYRRYLISHEVGHVLGHHHESCPGPGVPAPVMVQQTLGIGECAPNPWPAPDVRTG